jgi:hypothetical protein
MDTPTYITLRAERRVFHVLERLQKGSAVEVWHEFIDFQNSDQATLENLESNQDFLRRVADAEPGTIEDGHEYIVLLDKVVQEEGGDHLFHAIEANRYMAAMNLSFQRV